MSGGGAGSKPSKAAQPPGADWHDAYFALEERFRQLKQQLNERESEVRLLKVAERKHNSNISSSNQHRRSSKTSPDHTTRSLRRVAAQRQATTKSDGGAALGTSDSSVGGGGTSAHGMRRFNSNHHNNYYRSAHSNNNNSNSYYNYKGRSNERSLDEGSDKDAATQGYLSNETHDLTSHAQHNHSNMVGSDADDLTAAAEAAQQHAWLPDPAMLWSAEGSARSAIAAQALYHANEELRQRLHEAGNLTQSLQQELAQASRVQSNKTVQLEELQGQLHLAIRERDAANARWQSAEQLVRTMETNQQRYQSEIDEQRFGLESQVSELRGRLVAGADSNEQLSQDVRTLLQETRSKTAELCQLRSQLTLAESSLAAQRSANANMLLEVRQMNEQLLDSRRQLLAAVREGSALAERVECMGELECTVQQLTEERTAVEKAHVALMAEFVSVTDSALRNAREEVQAELAESRKSAAHYERVAELLYADVAERTRGHVRCRAECESAKAQRDESAAAVRSLRSQLDLAEAKLSVVWPTHDKDTAGMGVGEVTTVFASTAQRRRQLAQEEKARTNIHDNNNTTSNNKDGPDSAYNIYTSNANKDGNSLCDEDAVYEAMSSTAEQLRELHEANATLLAELTQLRLSNELLQSRLASINSRHDHERSEWSVQTRQLRRQEALGHALLAKQKERADFLESQVRSLRGYSVSPDTALTSLEANENVFELFLGQLVASPGYAGLHRHPRKNMPLSALSEWSCAPFFCSVDFLLHETVTTCTVMGLGGFFDTTIGFCIAMNPLLLYYLRTRQLVVQLHRVCDADPQARQQTKQPMVHHASQVDNGNNNNIIKETTEAVDVHRITSGEETDSKNELSADRLGSSSQSQQSKHGSTAEESHEVPMYDTVAEGKVSLLDLVADRTQWQSDRPALRGHVRLLDTQSKAHCASLEFQLTARLPFDEAFRELLQNNLAEDRDADMTDESMLQTMQKSVGVSNDNNDDHDYPAQARVNRFTSTGNNIRTSHAPARMRNPFPRSPSSELSSPDKSVPSHWQHNRRATSNPIRGHKPSFRYPDDNSNTYRDDDVEEDRYDRNEQRPVYRSHPPGRGEKDTFNQPLHAREGGEDSRHTSSSVGTWMVTPTPNAAQRSSPTDAVPSALPPSISDAHASLISSTATASEHDREVIDQVPSSSSSSSPTLRARPHNRARSTDALSSSASPAPPPHYPSYASYSNRGTESNGFDNNKNNSGHPRSHQTRSYLQDDDNDTAVTRRGSIMNNRNADAAQRANAKGNPISRNDTNVHKHSLSERNKNSKPVSTGPRHRPHHAPHTSASRLYRASPISRSTSDTLLSSHRVRQVGVDVMRVELSAARTREGSTLAVSLPRLSCYYTLPGWDEMSGAVYLKAPCTAQFTIEYAQPTFAGEECIKHDAGATESCAALGGTAFVVRSSAQLHTLAREPVVLFFTDEEDNHTDHVRHDSPTMHSANSTGTDANRDDSTLLRRGRLQSHTQDTVWAMAACEFAPALHTPNVAVEYDLPLMRRSAVVVGARVRVRLWACTEDHTTMRKRQQGSHDNADTDKSNNNDGYSRSSAFMAASTPALPLSLEEEMMRVMYDDAHTRR